MFLKNNLELLCVAVRSPLTPLLRVILPGFCVFLTREWPNSHHWQCTKCIYPRKQVFKRAKAHPPLPHHSELPFLFRATNCHEGVRAMAAEGRRPGWKTPSSLTMNWVLSLETRIWVVWLPISTWFKRNTLYTIFSPSTHSLNVMWPNAMDNNIQTNSPPSLCSRLSILQKYNLK